MWGERGSTLHGNISMMISASQHGDFDEHHKLEFYGELTIIFLSLPKCIFYTSPINVCILPDLHPTRSIGTLGA